MKQIACGLVNGPLALLVALFLANSSFAAEPDRSPVDLVLSADERWLVTANQTSATLSLVDVASGRVLQEQPTGKHPTTIALSPNGRVLASCRDSGELRVYAVRDDRLVEEAVIELGFHPHGIAAAPDGKTAYVALTAADQIAVVDLQKPKVTARIDVARWPRYLAISPDGSRLVIGASGDRGIAIVDTKAQKQVHTQAFVGINIGHVITSHDGEQAVFPWMVYRANPITTGNIRLGWVLASRLGRVRFDGESRREAVSTDPPGKAVADPFGIALTSDDARMVVSAAGTHELLLFGNKTLPWLDYGGTDHIEPELLEDKDRFDRIELGGRPMGLRMAKDDRTVYVANYLQNAVQVVDIVDRKIVREIPIGGPEKPSLVRQGEAIFYDARRSLDQWYSCHSCHQDGSTNAVAMDTFNDDTAFTFKTVLPLYHVQDTSPWTWHGWQTDLHAAASRSITSTMLGPKPSDHDVEALVAFMKSIDGPPNPFRNKDGSLSEAASRGKLVFESEQAGCTNCHTGPRFTDGEVHDVGTGGRGDRYQGFNTPSLVNVYHKVKLLHDGRAASLDEVLTGDHAPERVAGEKLTDQQRADLIAYLKSL